MAINMSQTRVMDSSKRLKRLLQDMGCVYRHLLKADVARSSYECRGLVYFSDLTRCAELHRQGVTETLAGLGLDPMPLAKVVIKAADGGEIDLNSRPLQW
jgi:hypothetical protein